MPQQPILVPGQSQSLSMPVVVNDGEAAIISAYTPDGSDIISGPTLTLEYLTTAGYMTVSTVGYGVVVLKNGCQQLHIPIQGTYRIRRPDISAWGQNVGVEVNLYSTIENEDIDFDAMAFSTDYSGLDSLSCGEFTDNFEQRYDAGSF